MASSQSPSQFRDLYIALFLKCRRNFLYNHSFFNNFNLYICKSPQIFPQGRADKKYLLVLVLSDCQEML